MYIVAATLAAVYVRANDKIVAEKPSENTGSENKKQIGT